MIQKNTKQQTNRFVTLGTAIGILALFSISIIATIGIAMLSGAPQPSILEPIFQYACLTSVGLVALTIIFLSHNTTLKKAIKLPLANGRNVPHIKKRLARGFLYTSRALAIFSALFIAGGLLIPKDNFDSSFRIGLYVGLISIILICITIITWGVSLLLRISMLNKK